MNVICRRSFLKTLGIIAISPALFKDKEIINVSINTTYPSIMGLLKIDIETTYEDGTTKNFAGKDEKWLTYKRSIFNCWKKDLCVINDNKLLIRYLNNKDICELSMDVCEII